MADGFWVMPTTFRDVHEELERARRKHVPHASTYEGYAVVLKQVDDLWREVKKRNSNPAVMRRQCVQIAAMAVRFADDLVPPPEPEFVPEPEEG